MRKVGCWGNNFDYVHALTDVQAHNTHLTFSKKNNELYLPHGLGRSYGDSCLNDKGSLLLTRQLDKILHFDRYTGSIICESGVSIETLLNLLVPVGWFVPVTAGTKFITVGGAIANDIHGKNHHRHGSFGCFVKKIKLLRSNGETLICSREQNVSLFYATIGGLGLTGLILWAEFTLRPIHNPFLFVESTKFSSVNEFFELTEAYNAEYEYTVSWIDCLSSGSSFGRGVFMTGNLLPPDPDLIHQSPRGFKIKVPNVFPNFLLNPLSMHLFNEIYYRKQTHKIKASIMHYDKFYYPLDSLLHWNHLYGRRGFLQYQCVVPYDGKISPIHEILNKIVIKKIGSFLAVLKTFGDISSGGYMSFPKKGVTLAVDFPNTKKTRNFLHQLDEIVVANGGCVYPAKDSRMSKESFAKFFPKLPDFIPHIDPKFSSSFWRRVTQE